MSRYPLVLLACLGFVFGLASCTAEERSGGSVEAAAPPASGFVGTWDVKGTTEDLARGDTRTIHGTVVLAKKEGVYTGASQLSTQFPAEGGAVHADMIGGARGERDGNFLRGTAETQLVMGTVPGVNPEFAFIPRSVGPRIKSKFTAHFRRDGTLVVELENEGAEGESYAATRTTLYGKLKSDGPGS